MSYVQGGFLLAQVMPMNLNVKKIRKKLSLQTKERNTLTPQKYLGRRKFLHVANSFMTPKMTNSTPNPHDKTTWRVHFLQHIMDHHTTLLLKLAPD